MVYLKLYKINKIEVLHFASNIYRYFAMIRVMIIERIKKKVNATTALLYDSQKTRLPLK
jgi:hypothetical protein